MEKKKILVIDDEEGLLTILKMRLELEGYTVLTSLDGEQGIAAAKAEKPDLIFLDIGMPKMSGEDVLRILKADPATRSIPVIVLSGKAGAGNIVEFVQEIGASDYIVKPFTTEDMMGKINTALIDAIEKKIETVLGEQKE